MKRGNEMEVDAFKRIKRRALILCGVKAFLLGLALALPTLGVLLLLYRFEKISFKTPVAILISAGVLLCVAVTTFLVLRRSGKAIAMKLDREHKLSEKVQTMLAFSGEDSPILALQRKDANDALASVSGAILGIKTLWIHILCFVLGLGIFLLSFMFNPVPEPDPEPEPEIPFSVTEMQLAALQELINSVNASEMDSPYRENIAATLTSLYDDIKEVTTLSAKNEAVGNALEAIYLQTDESSYAVEIINSLWKTNAKAPMLLAKALNYYDWPKTGDWEKFIAEMAEFREGFIHPDATVEDADEDKISEDTKNILLNMAASITAALLNNKVSEQDELYAALTRLSSVNEQNADGTRLYGMQILAEYIVENGYTKTQRELDTTVAALNGEIYKALSGNKINTDTGEGTMTTLSGIFDVKAPDYERPELNELTDGAAGDEEGSGGGGGISGGPSYGSDDKVYDPFTNKYVEYGTILDKYYEIMFNKIQDDSYTDDEKKALEKYFEILYGGFKESDK